MDKTEIALICLLLAVVVGAALLMGAGSLGASTPVAQAGIAAPGATMAANSIGVWLLKALGVLVGLLALLAAGFYGYDLVKRRAAGNWLPGPNARWKHEQVKAQPTEPKTSLIDMLVALLLKQAFQGGGMGYQPPAHMPDEDKQPLDF